MLVSSNLLQVAFKTPYVIDLIEFFHLFRGRIDRLRKADRGRQAGFSLRTVDRLQDELTKRKELKEGRT